MCHSLGIPWSYTFLNTFLKFCVFIALWICCKAWIVAYLVIGCSKAITEKCWTEVVLFLSIFVFFCMHEIENGFLCMYWHCFSRFCYPLFCYPWIGWNGIPTSNEGFKRHCLLSSHLPDLQMSEAKYVLLRRCEFLLTTNCLRNY